MTKLWETNKNSLDKKIEEFTVWDDYIIDKTFLAFDIKASLAHASMLHKVGILNKNELKDLEKWFKEILKLFNEWKFDIEIYQEDWHTAIEEYLTKNYWNIWKKIHTWRSRNDQSLTMIRLYMLESLKKSINKVDILEQAINKKSKENIFSMPWYTHMQKAMPTDVKTWLNSYKDAISDQKILLKSLEKIFNQSPLWSAAWFWIKNFKNDRNFSANIMWFKKVQENPMYCWISRWLFEYNFLSNLWNILLIINRLNNDILLFTTQEFDYVSLPQNMTTGSSIMPNKRNYDVCELVRWKISLHFWYETQIKELYSHLFWWYQRDLQLTKSILINWYTNWNNIIDIFTLIIKNLWINEDKLKNSMTDDIYATQEVYNLVSKWLSFREAYKKVKKSNFS